jgi:hypothetical protein
MNKLTTTVLTVLFFALLASATAMAQDNSRNWDNGPVVAVTEVHVKDGMFNAYVNDLNSHQGTANPTCTLP